MTASAFVRAAGRAAPGPCTTVTAPLIAPRKSGRGYTRLGGEPGAMARIIPATAREWVAWLSPGLLILAGVVLFFIPAPPTSLLGIALILVGAVLWLIDYFGGEREGEGQMSAQAGD